MADIKAFIKKWNGRTLQDDGCYVSKEYHSFQVAFMNAMRKIANSVGGELVSPSYGHYDMSGFIKRGLNYVYFSYDTSLCEGGRTKVILKGKGGWHSPLLLRTAKDARDFRGGCNNYESFENCEGMIARLLDLGHSERQW